MKSRSSDIELQEIQSVTRPVRIAWLLPPGVTGDELHHIFQWSTEHVGLWRSALWQTDEGGRLDRLGEHLVRKFDPDVLYGIRLNVDDAYYKTVCNAFASFPDHHVLGRPRPAAPVVAISAVESAEPHQRVIDRWTFTGDALKVLWAESQLGTLSDHTAGQLAAGGATINTTHLDLNNNNDLVTAIATALDGGLQGGAVVPAAIQYRHIALMSKVRDSWYSAPAVVVVGDGIIDLCLYWTLRAIRSGVYWAPLTGLTTWPLLADRFRNMIRFEVPNEHQASAALSLSVAAVDLAHIAADIGPGHSQPHVDPTIVVEPRQIDELLPGLMTEVIMYSTHSESLPFIDRVSGAQLPKSSLGKIALARLADLHLYQEISLFGHRIPPRHQFNSRLLPERGPGSRASREGWSFNPLRLMTFAYDTWETAQLEPRLRIDTTLNECLAVFPVSLGPRLSTAGQYLTRAIDFFEGPLEAAGFLTRPWVARLLDVYRRNDKKPGNDQLPGEVMHDRRYLDFHDVAIATGLGGDELRAGLEELVVRRVLRRGFAFQCPACRWADFYRLGTFGDDFECRQCGHSTRWQLRDAHQPEAPELFYALDEIIYRVADTDGHAVLRALTWLSQGISSFMVAPGVDLNWPDEAKPWEVDALLLLDGRVVLLEVKNAQVVEQVQLNRYQTIAEQLPADEVCVVSTKGGWDEPSAARIEQLRATLAFRYIGVRSHSLDLESFP